jgi:hypothetical protein
MRLHKFNRRWALIKLNLRQNKEKYIKVGTLVFSIVIFIIGITFFAFAKFNTTNKFNAVQTTVGNFTTGDYTMFAYVDGVKSDTIPSSTDGYTVYNITCTNNATGKWDTTNWSLVISGATASGTKCNVYFGKLNNFDYTGDVQSFIAPKDGYYQLQAWGAQGAGSLSKGAYTSGKVLLSANETIYIYVGEGLLNTSNSTSFNGGTADTGGCPGGGATDFRLVNGNWNDATSLTSRIMVAAGSGAGSGNNTINLGAGGALSGLSGGGTAGGTQVAAGERQATTYANSGFGFANGGCTGGGGYYGGGGSTCVDGAGGGSSYISGYTGCVAITSATDTTPKSGCTTGTTDINCSYHYSGKLFTSTIMKAGNETMPTHDGTDTMPGNSGNGYAKIIYIGLTDNETSDSLKSSTTGSSTTITNLGSGSTFDVSSYSGYQSFTIDNFYVVVTKTHVEGWGADTQYSYLHGTADVNVTKAYNSTTGTFTLGGLSGAAANSAGNTGSFSLTCTVYLVH